MAQPVANTAVRPAPHLAPPPVVCCSSPTRVTTADSQLQSAPPPISRPTKSSPLPPATPGELSIAKNNRAFAVSLYRQLATKPGNVVISPLSIAAAFGPVDAGARGDTQAEIIRALNFPAVEEDLHRGLGSLLDTLETGDNAGQVSFANAMWLMKDFEVKPGFVDVAKRYYHAKVDTIDFNNSSAAAARINTWVDGETKGRIPKLFEDDAFDPDTRVVVTNAAYFLSDWKVPFAPYRTRPRPFYLADGTVREVPLMSIRMLMHSAETDAVQIAELPYKGDRLSMVVILPKSRKGLSAVEAKLSAAKLDEWLRLINDSKASDLEISLPKVQMESSFDLVRPLKALGMKAPFTPRLADFSGIAGGTVGRRLYISDALHKTFLRIDEKGTEAAAATGVVISIERGSPEFTADHPFLFLIRDKPTGAILFVGRIAEP